MTWRNTRFSDVIQINPMVPMRRGIAYPYADMKAITVGAREIYPSEQRVFASSGSRFIRGDTLMARITPCLENGKIGRFFGIPGIPAHGSTEFIVFRGKEEQTDNDYVYYLVKSDLVKNYAIGHMNGSSGRQRVPTEVFKNLEIDLPPLSEQNAIAKVLGALDDKIDLNRRMNETLEAMARAIFKDWFVDFGPTRAKMEGREPYLSPDLWALFPDRLGDDGLPMGWEMKKIDSFVERLNVGKKYESKTVEQTGRVPVLDQGKSGIIGYHNDEPGLSPTPDKPIIVFANHTCYMRLVMFPFSAIQNVLPFVGHGVDTLWTYFATLDKQKFIEYKGHWPDFVIHEVAVPSTNLTFAFSEQIASLCQRIFANEQENEKLAKARDMLLPKLMTGEVRVKSNIISLADFLKERALRSCREHGYVDIPAICREQYIVTVEDLTLPSKAELRYENDSFFIYTRSKQDFYSLAHELAHWATDGEVIKVHGVAARKGESSMSPQKETEADNLAADILMPDEFVREYLGESPTPDEKLVKRLQKQLRVTEPAMHYRLGNLGYKMPYRTFKNSEV
jgi:type I restriction enzyme S subunit